MLGFLKPKVKSADDYNVKITKEDDPETLSQTILKIYKFQPFNHEIFLPRRIAEMKANYFTPKNLNFEIKNQVDLVTKIKLFFISNNFNSKHWIVNNISSLQGKSAWLVCNASTDKKLNLLPVRLIKRNYDILGQLVSCTIAYDDYVVNQQTMRLQENYTIDFEQKKVTVERTIYNASNNEIVSWNDKDKNINNHLSKTQNLKLTYIPVVPWPNLPNEKPDCAYSCGRIKALDVSFEQVLLDWIINASRVVVNENIVGNDQEDAEQLIINWIKNSILVTDFDPDEELPVSIVSGTLKGKELRDAYDWLKTDIYRETGVPVAAAIKGAQQSINEITSQNTETNNLLEQQISLREIALTQLIKMLLQFDKDLLVSKTFSFTDDIEQLEINVELEMNITLQNQLQGAVANVSTKETTDTLPA